MNKLIKVTAKEQKAFGYLIIELSKFKNSLDQSKVDYPVFDGSVNVSTNKNPFLNQLPAVYFFHDLRGIHYIGETENLRFRFFQHIKKNKNLNLKAAILSAFGPMFFSWVVASSKMDALIMQKKWIRVFKPQCNEIKFTNN